MEQVRRQENAIKQAQRLDAKGAAILDGFLSFEGLIAIADVFLSRNDARGYRNRYLALMSASLFTR
jgi:hypothetical protein